MLIVGIGVLAGLLIGVAGIGGVILVPLLSIEGVPVHNAIAASMLSYVFGGLAGGAMFLRRRSVGWRSVTPLAGGAVPGAVCGSLIANAAPPELLLGLSAAIVAFAIVRQLRRRPDGGETTTASPGALALFGIGALAGCGAAMTGTSGPLMLISLLLIGWRLPMLLVVGLGQAVQVPIAVAATFANILGGRFEPAIGLLLATGLVGGSLAGGYLAHALPSRVLSGFVEGVLVLAGVMLLVRLYDGAV